jgi:hypothetical protein
MKQKIRQGVFETNSSSSHSVSISAITENTILDIMLPDEDGNIVLIGGKFGWEVKQYNDAWTKANYCAIDFFYNPDKISMLIQAIKEQTGCNDVLIKADLENWDSEYNSYIDHQSSGIISNEISSIQDVKNFIFNPNSCLQTDNDN